MVALQPAAAQGPAPAAGTSAGGVRADESPPAHGRRADWRNTLSSPAEAAVPAPPRRTMSAEERNHLRQHMRDATREGYPDAAAGARPTR